MQEKTKNSLIPLHNVTRIIKKGLPPNIKLQKEAKELVQESISEFIVFLTNGAQEKCNNDKRKVIVGEDVLSSLKSYGYENYVQSLNLYLQRIRENIKESEEPAEKANKEENNTTIEKESEIP